MSIYITVSVRLEEVMVKVEELQENQIAVGTGSLGRASAATEDKILQLETQVVIDK